MEFFIEDYLLILYKNNLKKIYCNSKDLPQGQATNT